MHIAVTCDNLEALKVLIDFEKGRLALGSEPSNAVYNWPSSGRGWPGPGNKGTPVFCAVSSGAVELFLTSGLADLKLEDEEHHEQPLLHHCVSWELIEPADTTIVDALETQLFQEWRGMLPIQLGM